MGVDWLVSISLELLVSSDHFCVHSYWGIAVDSCMAPTEIQ